jgi:hypothetical protein
MEATVSHSSLNPVQLHLLKLFSFTKREEGLKELQSVLFNYYRSKLKTQTDDFWKNNNLDVSKMEEIMYGHNRILTQK